MQKSLFFILLFVSCNGLMAQWDKVYPVKNGYSAVIKDKKFGFIDANQKVVIAPKYEMAYDFNSDGLVVVKKDGKFGCIDIKENVIIAFKYDKLFKFVNHVSPYIQGNGTGLIRDDGTLLTKPVYTKIYKQKEGYYLTVNNDKYGFLDLNGTEVIPFIYDKAEGFKGGQAKIIKDGRTGFVNKDGTEVFGYELGQYLEKEGGIVIQLDESGFHGLVLALENATERNDPLISSGMKSSYLFDFPHNKLEGWRLPTNSEMENFFKRNNSIEETVKKAQKVSYDKFIIRNDIWLNDIERGSHYVRRVSFNGVSVSRSVSKTGEQYYVRYVREF